MNKVYLLFLLPAVLTALTENAFSQTTSGTLPVLINTSASLTGGNKVTVSWTILQKVEIDYFDVEKSNDGIGWRSIATVKANNDAAVPFTYNTVDLFPLKGINFYRVRMKDISGHTGLTAIKNVRVNTTARVNIYPNPSSIQVNVSLGQVPGTDWSVAIINLSGQVLVQKKYTRNITMVRLPVNNYPEGNYILEITEGNSKQSNALLINHH